MADVKSIEAAILRVAGNPASGPIRELARKMAEEVAALDGKPEETVKAKRVLDERETR
jgi:hypothetical protein